jgi:hypothetical protein
VNRTDLTQDGDPYVAVVIGLMKLWATSSENIGFSTRILLPGPVECGRHVA